MKNLIGLVLFVCAGAFLWSASSFSLADLKERVTSLWENHENIQKEVITKAEELRIKFGEARQTAEQKAQEIQQKSQEVQAAVVDLNNAVNQVADGINKAQDSVNKIKSTVKGEENKDQTTQEP